MGDGGPEEERAGTPYGEAEHMDGLRQAGFTIAPGGTWRLRRKAVSALVGACEAKVPPLRSLSSRTNDNTINVRLKRWMTERKRFQTKYESRV